MSKYQAYPEYKDSGIEWVGDIPNEWYVKPTFSLFDSAVTKNIDGLETNVLSLSYGKIIKRDVEKNFGLLPESFNTYQIVDFGDIILRLTDLQNDKRSLRVGLAQERGIITSAYLKLATKNELDAKFAYRLLHSYDTTKVFYGMGGGLRQSMKFEDFRRLPILVPPIKEQTQIAAFLDHETAKIDTLIEKQQQLIELLKEKRQAVISHAVTKGLNPDAPIKDSGVEWLGEVPEHWVVSKFSFLKKVLTDYTANGSFADLKANVQYLDEPSFARLVRLTDLRKDLQNDNGVWVDEKSYKYLKKSALFGGEFLLANVGAYAGLFYQMPFEKGPASLAPNMFMAKFDDSKVSRKFMAYVGQSSPVASQLKLSATASSAQPKLNKDDFKSVSFCYPVLPEQNRIVEYLDQEVRKIEQLLTKQEKTIALMQERRTALISAAVTGKIDVRGFTLPSQENDIAQEYTAAYEPDLEPAL
ncbi:restriction endonuclease subunit S [Photobacterium damselae subsp. piscicida]|uniref:restriction endonuclease subunit S n=1 Tax=Photobacterium damselae TaxID=38293 RepID=UPI000302B500|nr:restriction endonuclease subunit S [Photobacterium damselae]OLQ80904.1 hypothetical protein BEI67_13185 [Photobacterium damselae subsp. piscicida]TFZ56648.1 restriction endonuclease subunit S [Photobacterium damselae subsp. piscicida]TJZ99422.1 restriction endonuclease subunit S [Photobacterium damselae subsp. piscicida]BBC40663.1 type-1 restriction enzyme EcoKI specificity protein [Photobacterium damselae subsp. piscicida]